MESTLERIPSWLRWVLTPIASVATFVVVSLIANIASKILVFLSRDGWGDNFFYYLINPGLSAFCAISAAAIVAPAGKWQVAVVMAMIWIFFAGALTFFSILGGEWKGLISVVAVIFGVAYGVSEIEDPRIGQVRDISSE